MISFTIIPQKPYFRLEIIYDYNGNERRFANNYTSPATAQAVAASNVRDYLLRQTSVFIGIVDALQKTADNYYMTDKRAASYRVIKDLVTGLQFTSEINTIAVKLQVHKKHFKNVIPYGKSRHHKALAAVYKDVFQIVKKLYYKNSL